MILMCILCSWGTAMVVAHVALTNLYNLGIIYLTKEIRELVYDEISEVYDFDVYSMFVCGVCDQRA